MRWLITGAQGFIGRYICAHILVSQPDATVVGIGRSAELNGCFSHNVTGPSGTVRAPLSDCLTSALGSRFQYCSIAIEDVVSMMRLLQTVEPEIILHLASSLRGATQSELLRTNVAGTESLFASILLSGVALPKVVIASTGGVYGEVASGRFPSRESDACNPVDAYSVSKLRAENSARRAATAAGISLAIVRIFNVLGPGQNERHVAGRIAAQLMSIERGCAEYLSLGVLHCTRDFIDVRDAARAAVTVCDRGEGMFNIGTGVECSVADLLNEFMRHVSVRPVIQSHASDGGLARNCADIARVRGMGFEPRYSLSNSVTAILAYYDRLWGLPG